MPEQNNSRKIVVTSAITAIVLMLFGALIVSANRQRIAQYLLGNTSQSINAPETIQTITGQGSVVNAVKKANPAVVSIIVSKNVSMIERYTPFDFFGQFFGDPSSGSGSGGTSKQEIGGGSGFLVSADGLIVTNKHVVSDTEAEYTVFTNDGKKHTATVVARDPGLDIAFIRISGSNYPSTFIW
jgi:S1-C subfamily serine protease